MIDGQGSGCRKKRGELKSKTNLIGLNPLLQIIVGKELPSSRLRFLGGIAWRTPASGDGDTRGLDCFIFFGFRVVCVKRRALSVDRRFSRTRIERAFLNLYLSPFL
jgi:hypothetical protein